MTPIKDVISFLCVSTSYRIRSIFTIVRTQLKSLLVSKISYLKILLSLEFTVESYNRFTFHENQVFFINTFNCSKDQNV